MDYAEEAIQRVKAEVEALQPIPLSGIPNFAQQLGPREFSPPFDPPPVPPTEVRFPFEVYITGYTDANYTTANVYCYRGTVLNDEEDITDVIAITDIDTSFELTSGDWLYLDVTFDADGEITGITLKKATSGGWTGYPSLSPSSTKWIHPICNVRAFKSGKAGSGIPDSGEWSQIESGLFISQKTNTHLVKVQACIGGANRWKLVPGTGGKD